MAAPLHNPPLIQYKDLIRLLDSFHPVRNHNQCFPSSQGLDSLLQLHLVLRVNIGRGLVQNDDRRILEHGPGDGEPLAFSAGDRGAALTDDGIVAVRQGRDKVMAPGRLCRGHHLLMGGVRLAELDVVLNAVVEQVHALKDHTEIAHQTIQRIVLHIDAAQLDRAAVHIPKPCHKTGEGGLAGAGGPHDGSGCPFRDSKADIADDFPLPIGKVHMLEGNIAVFRCLYGAAFVHPGCAVNLLHPVDGSVDHRQHEEHLTGRLQLAVYQESGNHHHQAGKKGHTALQEKPD